MNLPTAELDWHGARGLVPASSGDDLQRACTSLAIELAVQLAAALHPGAATLSLKGVRLCSPERLPEAGLLRAQVERAGCVHVVVQGRERGEEPCLLASIERIGLASQSVTTGGAGSSRALRRRGEPCEALRLSPRVVQASVGLLRGALGEGSGWHLLAIDELVVVLGEAEVDAIEAREESGRWELLASAHDGRIRFVARGVELGEWSGLHEQTRSVQQRLFARALEAVLPAGTGPVELREAPSVGVTSLDLVRACAWLHEQLGWAPSLAALRQHVQLAQTAPGDARARGPELVSAAPAPAANPGAGTTTAFERRLWLIERHSDARPAYNEGVAWIFEGALDRMRLEAALRRLVERHEALRTTFRPEDAGFTRVVSTTAHGVPVEILPVEHGSLDAASCIRTFVRRPFDLERGPLLRAALGRLPDGRTLLVLGCHHIVSDEWSLLQIARSELAALYLDPSGSRLPDAPALSAFARWESSSARRASGLAAAARIATELAGARLVLELPSNCLRPARARHEGAKIAMRLPDTVRSAVAARALRCSATPFTLLCAAFAAAVARLTGEKDFVLGVPVSLREPGTDDSLFGALINTVPLRCRVDPTRSFAALVADIGGALSRALESRDAPFESVVCSAHCERSPSRSPLIQVVCSYHELPDLSLVLDGARGEPVEVDAGTSKFDLTAQFYATAEALHASWEYDTALYEGSEVREWLEQYIALLEACVATPELPLGDVAPASVRRSVLRGPELAAAPDVRAGLRRALESDQQRVVLSAEGRDWTPAELGTAVRARAQVLAQVLAAEDRIVAVEGTRSVRWLVDVLALLSLGRTYLPFASGPGADSLRQALVASGVTALCTEDGAVTRQSVAGAGHGAGVVDGLASAKQTFYAIATSGSTGTPKVSVASERGVANMLAWYCKELELSPADRVLVVTSPVFDLTQKNVLAPLLAGARLVLSEPRVFDPRVVLGELERHAISVINCTPTLFGALLRAAAPEGYQALSSLRAVVLGGEPPELSGLASWQASGACNARVMNSYGPSECADVCCFAWLSADQLQGDAVPIGTPVPNCELRVEDAAGRCVPLGVRGELVVRGAPVGAGYLGVPSGAPSGYRRCDGVACYHTGDQAFVDRTGQVWFLGRDDAQRKVRGYRVELGAIEHRIRLLDPRIEGVAVVVADPAQGQQELRAFLVSPTRLELGALRRALGREVPAYMVPERWQQLAALPEGETGKVDRKALLELTCAAEATSTVHANEFEARVAAVLAQVLRVPSLDADVDFFEAGGNSLLAIEAAEAFGKLVGVVCSLADFVEGPTARRLCARFGYGSEKPGA